MAYILSHIVALVSVKAKQQTTLNLRNTNGPNPSSIHAFFVEMLKIRILQYFETMYHLARTGACVAENAEEFATFMQKNSLREKGVLAVTAHLGNWELMGSFMTTAMPARRCIMLAKKNKYDEISRLVESLRKNMGMDVLFISEKNGIKSIMKNLHKDTLIGLVADQKSAGRTGPKAMFFGKNTDFVSGPQRLSLKFGVPLLFCYAVRTGPLKYRVEYSKLEPSDGQSLQTYTQEMASEFEQAIRRSPEQWVWDYKKWIL